MQITAQQLATFDEVAEERFVLRIVAHLRQRHAECSVHAPGASFAVHELPDAVLLKLVAVALRRGRAHGLTWQSTLNMFATLMFKVAPNFDVHPKVAQALAHDSRPPDFRMRDLPMRLAPADWRVAAAAYDPQAWFVAAGS